MARPRPMYPQSAQSTWWFDTTTLYTFRRIGPVGLSRVEANVIRAALAHDSEHIRFCRFDRYTGQFIEVGDQAVSELLQGFGTNAPSRKHAGDASRAARFGMQPLLKQTERVVRKSVRKYYGQVRSSISTKPTGVDFQRGDALILSGSTWDTLDMDQLERRCSRDGLNLVAVVCDMIPWKYPHQFEDSKAVESFLRFCDVVIHHASAVACISQSTESDLLQYAREHGVQTVNTRVMHLGADIAGTSQQPERLPSDLLRRGFVLSVGTLQVRKNHQLLYQLWRRFAEEGRADFPRLVLVGGNGWMTEDLRRQMLADPMIRDSILILNRATDAELRWLYENCRFSLYPALYEGWGLPIVESLAHGRPCIASNTSSMPEAGQGLATHIDPMDFRAWHQTITRWVAQPQFVADLSNQIRSSFELRSWEGFGDDFLRFVESSTLSTEAAAA